MTYITPDGNTSRQEAATHYVSICHQIEALDRVIARSSITLKNAGLATDSDPYLVEKTLDVNDKAWNRREWLVANRKEAFEALSKACRYTDQRIDELISLAAEAAGENIAN